VRVCVGMVSNKWGVYCMNRACGESMIGAIEYTSRMSVQDAPTIARIQPYRAEHVH
jgi:hypothetical protein